MTPSTGERTPAEMLEVIYDRASTIRSAQRRRFRVGMASLAGCLVAAGIAVGLPSSRDAVDVDPAKPSGASPTYWHLDTVDPTASDLTVVIEGGACMFDGDEYDRPVVDRVDLKQNAGAVTITVFVRPGHPRPAKYANEEFCPGVGTIDYVPVHLESPLGDRQLLDGACVLIEHRPRPLYARCDDSSFPGYARDIEAVLPTGTVAIDVAPNGGDGSYDEIYLEGPDYAKFRVTMYRDFDQSEVQTNGTRLPADGGIAWTGAHDPDLTSIYFLGSNGVGLRIESQKPGGEPLPQSRLVALAQAIAEIPSVVDRTSG